MEAQLHIINVYLFLKQFNKFASPSLFCPSLSPTYFPSFLSWVFHGSNMLPAKHKTSSWVPEGQHACHSGTLSKWASSSYLKIRSDILHKFALWVNEIIWMHLVIHKHQSEWWVFQNQKTLHLISLLSKWCVWGSCCGQLKRQSAPAPSQHWSCTSLWLRT